MPGAIGADEIYSGDQFVKIEEFLERLEGVQKSGGGWIARCPAHGDSNPSLSVSESGNRILVHCHAGCKPDEIVAAMGLKMKDLFTDTNGRGDAPDPDFVERNDGGAAERAALGTGELSIRPDDGTSGNGKKSGKRPARKWICEYIYRNVDGSAAYKIDRFLILEGKRAGEKDMLHMRPDPDSNDSHIGWTVLSRLPRRGGRLSSSRAKRTWRAWRRLSAWLPQPIRAAPVTGGIIGLRTGLIGSRDRVEF